MRKQFTVLGFYMSFFVFVLSLLFAYYGFTNADEDQKKGIIGLILFSSLFLFINWLNYRRFNQERVKEIKKTRRK
jgi:hypothetical protein